MTQEQFSGESIRLRREEVGLSVAQVARKTKVPEKFINAVETGNVRDMPAMCFSVGFLKTYCNFLELDSTRYQSLLQKESQTAHTFNVGGRQLQFKGTSAPWMRELIAWASITAVIALAWFAYVLVLEPGTQNEDRQVEADMIEMRFPDDR